MYIDTHAHLDFLDFEKDLEQVILRAQKTGVEKIINVATDLKSSQRVIKLAEKFPLIFASVSLHPLYAFKKEIDFSVFEKLAQHPKIVAIGETGLDYAEMSKSKAQMSKQREVFENFLKLAIAFKKPIILHCREAEEDFLQILSTQKKLSSGVWHCFGKDWNLAQKILNLGFLVSFTGSITYNLSKKTQKVIKEIPLEKIMIETDCPFMTPFSQRQRGIKRCEPAFVVEVAKKIAEIKKLPLSEIARKTSENAEKLFRI